MSIRIKRGANPIGAKHKFPTYVPGSGLTTPIYAVYDVHGDEAHVSSDGVTVFLKYADGRPRHSFSPTLCVTLNYLVSDCEAVTEEDVFWEKVKGSEIETRKI